MALQSKIFYERDSLDLLPKIIRTWAPGMFSWQFLVDLVELQHITLKMLDTNAKDSEGKIKILTKRKVVNKDDTANKGGETPDGESEVRFLRVHSCGGDAA